MDQSFQELIADLEAIHFRIFKSQELFECLAIKLEIGGFAPMSTGSLRGQIEVKIDILRTEIEMIKLKNQIAQMEQDHDKIYDHLASTFA